MNNGNTTEATDKWARFDAMTEEERYEAAMSDPDALPWTEEELDNVALTPRVKVLRRALGLTEEKVLITLCYPIGNFTGLGTRTQRKTYHTGYAYLRVIAAMPEAVQHALQPVPIR